MPVYQLNFISTSFSVVTRDFDAVNVHAGDLVSLLKLHINTLRVLLLLFKLYHVTFNVLSVITCYCVLLPDYLLRLNRSDNTTTHRFGFLKV